MQIIKQSPLVKIFTPDELLLLSGARNYKHKAELEIEQKSAQLEVDFINKLQEIELELAKRMETLSQQLYGDNTQQLDQLLSSLNDSMLKLINKVLHKLHITEFNQEQIKQLISSELLNSLHEEKVTIHCNNQSLAALKHTLFDLDLEIKYKINDNLLDEQCILEQSLAMIYVDLAKCKEQLLELFPTENGVIS